MFLACFSRVPRPLGAVIEAFLFGSEEIYKIGFSD